MVCFVILISLLVLGMGGCVSSIDRGGNGYVVVIDGGGGVHTGSFNVVSGCDEGDTFASLTISRKLRQCMVACIHVNVGLIV